MAKVLFAGGKANSLSIIGTSTDAIQSGAYNATYCDSAFQLSSGNATAKFTDSTGSAATVTSGQTLYVHFDFAHWGNMGAAGYNHVELRDSNGYPWVTWSSSAFNTWDVFYNSGTGASPIWTQLGSGVYIGVFAYVTIDIKVTIGSPHTIQFSLNGSLQTNASFTQSSLTNFAQFFIPSSASYSTPYFSQILCTEGISTIGANVKYTTATGAGSNSGWTGSYTDINEAIQNDATAITATSAGLKSTFAWGDVTVPTGYVIKDVHIWARAKNDGSSPANIKAVIRSSGTDYTGGNMAGIGTSYSAALYRTNVDPATSAAWTQAGFNAAEIGVQSAT